MLRELVEQAGREFVIPEIEGDRCVHALIERATCRACVDACPRRAWTLDDASLGIDTEACDGCGLCVPVCPEGVIGQRLSMPLREWRSRILAFACCEHAELRKEQEGVLACVHAIGTRDLMRLYDDGCRLLVVAQGDCGACARGNATPVGEAVDRVNRMLGSRGLPTLRLWVLEPEKWRDLMAMAWTERAGPQFNRRGFLRQALGAALEEGRQSGAPAHDRPGNVKTPGGMLPRISSQDVFPSVPGIDSQRCNGCDACVRLCPHEALTLESGDHGEACYAIRAQRCTGCGICVDVCDQKAIALSAWDIQPRESIRLTHYQCRSCGAPFHLPSCRSDSEAVCRICASTNHGRNLYQVISG